MKHIFTKELLLAVVIACIVFGSTAVAAHSIALNIIETGQALAYNATLVK